MPTFRFFSERFPAILILLLRGTPKNEGIPEDRNGNREITRRQKYRVLARFFRFAVTRGRLKASPMPAMEWKRNSAMRTPYIFLR